MLVVSGGTKSNSDRLLQSFKAESFPERNALLGYMLARKRTRSWGVRSKPPAVEFFCTVSLGKKDVSCFKRIEGPGGGEVELVLG